MQDIEQIYKQYFEVVNKYLFCLTHSNDIAEELTQETFYRAVKQIDKFKRNLQNPSMAMPNSKKLVV